MKSKIGLFVVALAAFVTLSGCASIGGVHREVTQKRELIKSGVPDTQKLSRVDIDYEFKKIKGEDWLAVQAKKVSYEQKRTVDVYAVRNITHSRFKVDKSIWLDVAGIGLGGFLYMEGSGDDNNANPYDDNSSSKNKNYKTAGLITAGVFAGGLLLDGIRALTFQKDSVETVREEKEPVGNIENRTVATVALKNTECTLSVTGCGDRKFQLDESGAGSVKVSDIPGFKGSLGNLVWATLSISGDDTTHEIKLNKALKAENDKRQQEEYEDSLRQYKQTVTQEMKEGHWVGALKALRGCEAKFGSYDGMDSQEEKIKANIQVRDAATAKLVMGVESETGLGMNDYVMKLLDPAANKNQPVVFNAAMFQTLGGVTRLVKVSDDTIIRVVRADNSMTGMDFVTGHPVLVYGVILGTHTYSTVEGGTNTVTNVKCYWMQSLLTK